MNSERIYSIKCVLSLMPALRDLEFRIHFYAEHLVGDVVRFMVTALSPKVAHPW